MGSCGPAPLTPPVLSLPHRDQQVHRLVLPLMLPSFYSELFTLYLLLHEQKDGRYSQGIASLSLFPDTKLLEFLDVQKYAWLAWGEIEDASSHRECWGWGVGWDLILDLGWLYH